MADLAYLIATEHDELREAANVAVRSLRRFGQFSGDIVVFTDRLFALPADVEQIVLAPHELERSALKCRAGSKLDLESYQRVLYLDADILVRAPLDGILARCRDRLVCTDDMGLTTRMDFFSRPFELVSDQMWFPCYHPNSPDLAGRTTRAYARTKARGPLAHYVGLRVRPDQLTRMHAEYAWQLLTRPLRVLQAA